MTSIPSAELSQILTNYDFSTVLSERNISTLTAFYSFLKCVWAVRLCREYCSMSHVWAGLCLSQINVTCWHESECACDGHEINLSTQLFVAMCSQTTVSHCRLSEDLWNHSFQRLCVLNALAMDFENAAAAVFGIWCVLSITMMTSTL